MGKFKIPLAASLIVIIVFAAFVPCLKNGFVNWDDNRYITDNLTVKSPVNQLKEIFTSSFIGHYHPLTVLSFAIEFRLFKLNPFYYHLTNLILHILNCLLVFWLFFILTGGRSIIVACLTALFFGIHPLQVESVAWVSERKNVLYALFFAGTMISYLYYVRKPNLLKYLLTFLLFLLALLSKSMALTLPLVLLALDYFLGRKKGKLLIEKIPFFLLSVVFGIIGIAAGFASGAVRNESLYNLFRPVLVASYGVVFYLKKIFLPFDLSCFYPYYGMADLVFYLFSLFATIMFLACIILSRRYTKKIVFGSGLFLITILPALQLIPNGTIIVADRYVYFSSIGIFYLIAEGFYWLWKKFADNRVRKCIFAVVLAIILVFPVLLTRKRCAVWENSLVLWSNVLEQYPFCATAYNNRGSAYLANGEYGKAYYDFMSALSFDKTQSGTYFNLGSLYNFKGRYVDAVKVLNEAIKLNPGDVLAYIVLCNSYSNLGNYPEAIIQGEKALAINPKSAAAHFYLAVAYFHTKKYELAKLHSDKAIMLGYEIPLEFLDQINLAKSKKN